MYEKSLQQNILLMSDKKIHTRLLMSEKKTRGSFNVGWLKTRRFKPLMSMIKLTPPYTSISSHLHEINTLINQLVFT